jgi:hypothetical protein
MRQARSLMADFLIDCYFNSFCWQKEFCDSALCRIAQSSDSALCRIAQSSNSALCHIALSFKKSFICDSVLCHLVQISSQKFSCRLRAMRHSSESTHIREFLCKFSTICKIYLTRWSVTQVGLIDEKNWGSKISWDCPINLLPGTDFSFYLKGNSRL